MNQLDRLNCEHVFKRLDDYLDRELTPREMELVREHLEICHWCASTYKFQEGVLNQLRERMQRIPVSARLLEKVSNALKQAQEEMRE